MEQALIGLLGVLLGLFVSSGLARVLELRRRRDRTMDLVTALHAEIVAGTLAASLQTEENEARYAQANNIPFGPADETDFVFQSIKNDISILPIEVIHEVVRYYKYAAQSNLYTNDLKHPLFLKQSPLEKRKYVRSLIGLMRDQQKAGEIALQAIEAHALRYGLDLAPKRKLNATRIASGEASGRDDEGTDGTGHDRLPSRAAGGTPMGRPASSI